MFEIDLHKAVADFLAATLPKFAVFFHVPNGELGESRVGAKLKRMGARPGVPDFDVISQGRAMFIELKTGRGRLSAAQKACIGDLENTGARVAICRTVEEVVAALPEWGVPLRGSVASSASAPK